MTLVCEMLIGIVNLSSVRIRRKSARSMHQLLGRQILLATNSCDPKFVQLDPRRRRPAFLRRKKYHDADFHITRRRNRCRWTAGDAPSREVFARSTELHRAKYAGSGGIVAANYLTNVAKPDGLTARRQSGELSRTDGWSAGSETRFSPSQLGRQFQPRAHDDRLP